MVRPSDESINLTITGPTKTLKIQGFDHKWQDFWSDQGRSGRTSSAGPDRVGPATSLVYQTGDVVFYKTNESSKWKGPVTVIGRDNHQVFVKHGGTYVRVNPCHLRRSTDTSLERSKEESKMINYKQQRNSDHTTVLNCELKDAQNDYDLSVNDHSSVGDPDIQQ